VELPSRRIYRSLQIKSLVSINGEIASPENACISVFDRGFLYGDSIYEVTQTFNKSLFKLEEHLDRLWHSAMKMDMPISFTREHITKEVEKVVEQTDALNVYVRIIVTRGEGEIGLDPNLSTSNNLIIITKELLPNPRWWYEDGVHMIVAHTIRNPKNAIDPSIKSGNYLNNILAMSEAKKRNAFDAIMLNSKGQVTEATTSNIWIVKDNELITAPIRSGLLGGITRKSLIEIAKENNITISEKNFTVDELKGADECFLTSTTKMIVPITKVDDSNIMDGKPGKLTKELLSLYKKKFGI
jgi:branched-chain amino acid aminotransferase